jgi:hypothetical protein
VINDTVVWLEGVAANPRVYAAFFWSMFVGFAILTFAGWLDAVTRAWWPVILGWFGAILFFGPSALAILGAFTRFTIYVFWGL